ncbi:glycosyltransferase family 1 protein [Nocardioidaceae bacterium]|nr:glycosyltransferase family 1 protein [Nocardioidaceae bacterium]
MRVLVVTESFLPQVNGVTGSVCRVVEQLVAAGHEPCVVAATGPDEYAGVPVRHVGSLPLPFYDGFRLGTPTRRTLRDLIRDHAPDVIHLASPALMGPRAAREARRLGVPVVAIYQTDLVGFADRYAVPGGVRAMTRLTRRAHRDIDLTLAPSTAARAQLVALGIAPDRVRIWGRGVDLERFAPGRRSARLRVEWGAPGVTVVGYMGRLAAEKELELLAPVQHMAGVRLVVVGDGPAREQVRRALPDAVHTGALHGTDLARAVASFDVFVHPGRHETFCQSVQEALACGVPAVVVDAGGPVDLVVPGENGDRFRPGDATDLTARVRHLVDHPLERAVLARRARAGVAGRGWDALGEELVGHYRDAITGGGTR